MTPTRFARRSRPASSVAAEVGRFLLAGVVALVVVGSGTAVAARLVGEREAIADARAIATTRAHGLVAPSLTDGILTGQAAAIEAVDRVVRLGVLDGSLVRAKVWSARGTILYSDEPRLMGSTFVLEAEELAALRNGDAVAQVSNLAKPENLYEHAFGRLLEVYLPIYTPSGEPLLFEAYFRYGAVAAAGNRLWRSFAPIGLGSLVVLLIVQLPLAWSLSARLRDRQREREDLLVRALDASAIERRRIASDLHDGVVQDLAGVAYKLSAAARQADSDAHPGQVELLEGSAMSVREGIKALRSLLVELYPPNLEAEGLESSVGALLAGATARGLVAELDAAGLGVALPGAAAQLLYRATQEAIRNVIGHAEAHTLRVCLTSTGDEAAVAVIDDGRGFDPADTAAVQAEGHVGLRGLQALVSDAGGTMVVRSASGRGTTVEVKVPLPGSPKMIPKR